MPERLTFTLAGRDELSRVMNGTADSADRLRLRMAGITADADGNLRTLQGRFLSVADAQRIVDDRTAQVRRRFDALSESSGRLGESIKANLISLAPAAIPATAALAGSAATLATQFGAVALAAGAYALALGPQISAIGDANAAQDKYEEAVRTSGATSQEAAKAQVAYQQQLDKMPPATREAAVAVGLLRDNFRDWSDELSGDVMGPFNKGVAVTNALIPKTSGLVRGASTQFDRLITLVGGAIQTPGFDRLNSKVTDFAERTMRRGVDEVTQFLAKLDSGELDDSGLQRFLDYARENGPVVWDTLQNVGDALLNVLEAGAEVGVGMLDVINALSGIVSAVPPEAIATMLQLAIAIKAVRLAAAAGAAAQAGVAAFGAQIVAMRAAAAGTPGRLAGVGAAITTLSRTAKLAVAGTGIGLLLIALSELSQYGKSTPPDVDKLTTSLGELGRTGKVTGEAAEVFGKDLEKLRENIGKVVDPSVVESINNWGADVTNGFLAAGDATEEFTENVGAIDESLAALVSQGNADLASAALERMLKGMSPEEVKKFRGELENYNQALKAQKFEQELAAESMGLFGEQAQEVQAKLDLQKRSTDGLRQSIIALNDVNRAALGAQNAFEQAIDDTSKAARENAGVLKMVDGRLDLNSQRARDAEAALRDLAAKTDAATTAARESGASWEEVSGTYERGRQQLIKNAMQMGLNRDQAKALAEQILDTPNKTAFLKGDVKDLKAKLADAKERLRKAPSEKKTKIRGEIQQLRDALAEARRKLDAIDGKTANTYVVTNYTQQRNRGYAGNSATGGRASGGRVPGYAFGGDVQAFPEGGFVQGPGTATSDTIFALFGSGARGRVSNTEYVVNAAAVQEYGVPFLDAINSRLLRVGRAAARAGLPAVPRSMASGAGSERPQVTYNVYPRASVISVEDLRLLQRQEEARQRVGRPR